MSHELTIHRLMHRFLSSVTIAHCRNMCRLAFVQALTAMQAEGLLKGGSEGCSIVGYGDRWYNSDSVRFFDDEPVRHKLLDILVRFGALEPPLSTCRRSAV